MAVSAVSAPAALFALLGRDGLASQQGSGALGGDAGKPCVRLRGGKIGQGLAQLLVEFGCFDLRQQRSLLHMRADVVRPVRQIAVGARVRSAYR